MLLGRLAIARVHAVAAELPQISRIVHSARCGKARQMTLAELYGQIAFVRNLLSVADRILIAVHPQEHFLLALQVEFLRFHPHTVGFIDKPPCLDAEEHVLSLGVLPADIVNIVGGNGFYVQLLGKLIEPRKHDELFGKSMILKLYIVVAAKQLLIP